MPDARALRTYFAQRREVVLWSLGLTLSWTAAWCVYAWGVAPQWPSVREHGAATLWWSAAKLVIWLLPVWLLVRRRSGEPFLRWLGLAHTRGLARGVLATIALVSGAALVDSLVPGRWPTRPEPRATEAVTVLLIFVGGPLLEEILYRGYALRRLQEAGSPFWRANAEAVVLFTLLHVPGWIFGGRSLGECLTLAPLIVFDGFVFGALRAGGASLWPCVVMHIANNAWRGGWVLLALDLLQGRL